MTIFWVDTQGTLIKATSENIPPRDGLTAVLIPPENGTLQRWEGSKWVDIANRDDVVAEDDIKHAFEMDNVTRLLFEINFDQEKRLRVMEGKPAINKTQYRDALKARLSSL